MASIITVNSIDKNVGVSTVTLTLAERLNYLSQKKTCIVELDYENPSFTYMLQRESSDVKNLDNILPYINEKNVVDNELLDLIRFNVKEFKNGEISILFGRRKKEKLNDKQLDLLLNGLRQIYELIIIDYGDKIIPTMILNNTEMNLLIVQSTYKYIDALKINRRDYITSKTQLLLNNCPRGLSEISFILNDRVKDVPVIGQLPASNTLVSVILKGMINVEKGDYSHKITTVALKICKYLNIETNSKKSFFSKLIGKNQDSRKEEVYLDKLKTMRLGEILIKEGICTKEDVDRCLVIQKNNLNNMNL